MGDLYKQIPRTHDPAEFKAGNYRLQVYLKEGERDYGPVSEPRLPEEPPTPGGQPASSYTGHPSFVNSVQFNSNYRPTSPIPGQSDDSAALLNAQQLELAEKYPQYQLRLTAQQQNQLNQRKGFSHSSVPKMRVAPPGG